MIREFRQRDEGLRCARILREIVDEFSERFFRMRIFAISQRESFL